MPAAGMQSGAQASGLRNASDSAAYAKPLHRHVADRVAGKTTDGLGKATN